MLIPKRITGARRLILWSLLIATTGAIVFIIYDYFFADDLAIKRAQRYDVGGAEIFQVPDINTNINASFLNARPYSELRQYGNLPINVGRTGRDNPFERINFSQ